MGEVHIQVALFDIIHIADNISVDFMPRTMRRSMPFRLHILPTFTRWLCIIEKARCYGYQPKQRRHTITIALSYDFTTHIYSL